MKHLKYKINLKLQSPLIVGGKKLGSNYIKSMDYVTGSVLRAALAKEILNRCSYYDKEKEKVYWVEFKNKSDCKNCKLKNMCKNFSNIKISIFYPLGSRPYPSTNMRCKYNSSHEDVDTLIYRINKHRDVDVSYNGKCPTCKERLEKHTGLGKDGVDVEGNYELITKNAINPYMKRSQEGILYSLDALSETMFLGDKVEDTEFQGTIECNADISKDLNDIRVVRIGAYTTSGFGKCSFTNIKGEEKKENVKSLENRIQKFNLLINDEKKYFVSLTLISDAYLELEKTFDKIDKMPSDIETEDFIKEYEKCLKPYLGEEFNLEIPIVNNEWRRGFDTSQKVSVYRKEKMLSKAGSVFVFSIPKEKINYEKLLKIQENGIGKNTEHGFGEVKVCSEFHIKNKMK